MLTTIIRAVIRHPLVVLFLLVAATTYSLYTIRTAPLDALPDISDSQVVVYVKWARSPEQLENKITRPVIQSLLGSTEIQSVRATSHLGYSFIYVIFQDRSQRKQIRQYVLDRLNSLRSQLPVDAEITLGPNASSMGWIYQYALVDHSQTRDLRELRLLNENIVKPALQMVAGVAEIATVGGLERQVELKIFPPLLAEAGISLSQIITALKGVFEQVGGRTIELTNRDYHLRGVVNFGDLDKLEYLIVARGVDGQPVLLKDIGYFQVNYDLRRGIADLDGEGEVVGAIVIMDQDQNVVTVSHAFETKLEKVKRALPDGIEIVTTYDRSSLIWATLKNFSTALAYELLVVILVIIWALRNGRAAVAPVLVILLGCLYTLLSLSFFGQTINLLSLAGLAIAMGEMADATIVIVENCSAELAHQKKQDIRSRLETIIRATARMMRPLLFSLLIILASFLPVFFLDDREGRLFDPLAFSKTFAMGFSTLLTLFLLPILIVWIFKGQSTPVRSQQDSRFVQAYAIMLRATIRRRYLFLGLSLVLLMLSVLLMSHFQKDYMPEMEEGSILYMPTTLPGLPIREAGWILQQIDRKIKAFPEVERVFGKLGRADTSTDPAPITMIETTILLKPESEWRQGLTKKQLISEMDEALKIIGYVNSWTQPIAGRVIMQGTGIQTPVGIKVKGHDIAVIEDISKQVEILLRNFPGTASVIAERISQGYFINVENDLQRLAEYNVTIEEAMLTVRYGIGGENIVNITQTDNTLVSMSMQYSPEYIDTLEKVKSTPVITANGQSIALGAIADVRVKKMPEMIRNDNGLLAAYIYINPGDITASDYVQGARKHLDQQLNLPAGYSLEWTGTYRYAEQAQARLLWIMPLTLVIMFSLLMLAFKSISISFLVLLSAPFALIGGVILQWFQGYAMTTAVVIGYIAVLAVAIQTGIIMIEFIREALARRPEKQPYMEAVIEGSLARLRPKLMTVATTVFGLVPIILASGSGMDVTRPIAAPSVGGMISSTIYVLFLIPCLFAVGDDLQKHLNIER
ncbi:Cobalt-zinc-cadmium resistance protein CzcA; Cation efflux system protein CusA [hydrothermal vent metagenome]|uniref:Cobalt-zinc-cadmium resistance protein CzcA Cation efflux system protein CusA n=1 Tax=hydrothermal vent metagenome TaxID=652676 RepID=A0A3B1AKN9_9ZZZZ